MNLFGHFSYFTIVMLVLICIDVCHQIVGDFENDFTASFIFPNLIGLIDFSNFFVFSNGQPVVINEHLPTSFNQLCTFTQMPPLLLVTALTEH